MLGREADPWHKSRQIQVLFIRLLVWLQQLISFFQRHYIYTCFMYEKNKPQKAFARGLTATQAEQRGGAATCGEEAGRETSRGRRAGSRKLALTVCQVLGWHLANAILVQVCETKETMFRRAAETEGSQPREQIFVSPRCHQQ